MLVILVLDSVGFKPKSIKHDKGHLLMLKARVYQQKQKRETPLYLGIN